MTIKPDINDVPDCHTIAAVSAAMNAATREDFEDWRQKISDAAIESGAIQDVFDGVERWTKIALERGDDFASVSNGTIKGIALSAFQLGYLSAVQFRAASTKTHDGAPGKPC